MTGHPDGAAGRTPSDDADLADTAPQPVLRPAVEEPATADRPLPGADGTVLPRAPRSRRRHVWLVVAATVLVAGGGAATYLVSRQAPAAARTPPSASPTPSGPLHDTVPQLVPGTPAALPPGSDTMVLGDSLALIVYPWLADLLPDRYVSYVAEVGSGTDWALRALEQRKTDRQPIPRVVLVSAGTNDWYAADFRAQATAVLDLLGPKRCVVWTTVDRPAEVNGMTVDPAADLNAVLRELARTYPNLHLVDWAAMTAKHPEWLAGDGVHPIEEGAQARAKAFARAATDCSPLDPDAPRAERQYLPDSAFFVGGSTSTTAATSASSYRTASTAPTRTTAPVSRPTTPQRTREPVPPPPPQRTRSPRAPQPPVSEAPPPPPADPDPVDAPPAPEQD